MASNRHLGRIIVLQSLYEYEFRKKAGDATAEIDTIVAKNIEPYAKALGDTEFVYNLARNVSARFQPLDDLLQPLAPEWPLSTIAAIDRNVLRIGLYELRECADSVPPKVARAADPTRRAPGVSRLTPARLPRGRPVAQLRSRNRRLVPRRPRLRALSARSPRPCRSNPSAPS